MLGYSNSPSTAKRQALIRGNGCWQVGLKYGLPLLSPVDDAGVFTEEAGRFQGLQVWPASWRVRDMSCTLTLYIPCIMLCVMWGRGNACLLVQQGYFTPQAFWVRQNCMYCIICVSSMHVDALVACQGVCTMSSCTCTM